MDQRPDSLFHNIVHERKSKADESSTLFFFVSFFLFLLLFIFFFTFFNGTEYRFLV